MKRIVICAVLLVLLCGCSNTTNKNVSSVPSASASVSEKKEYDRNIPVIDSSRIHVENGVLVKVDNLYEKEEVLRLPEVVVAIDKKALKFTREKKKEKDDYLPEFTSNETLHLCIPNRVKLVSKNFYGAGPLDVTFEEGRKTIEEGAFREAGCSGRCVKVTLPESCRKIEEKAFWGSHLNIKLNDGLVRIEDWALYMTCCDLPDSIEYLGNHALDTWEPEHVESSPKTMDITNFRLPEKLKVIGDYCIGISEYPSKPVFIPKGVKKIGKNAFTYLKDEDVKHVPHVQYKVAKENKWYYNDSKGNIHQK